MNFKAWGGRKQFNGYLYALLISIAAYVLQSAFELYAMWLSLALLGTSALHAVDDRHKREKSE